MNAIAPLQGRKGDSSSSTFTNASDTLRSADTYEIILGLCEGPIAGPANGDATSFMIGSTPVANPDGTSNFFHATINFFDGSHDPSYKITPIMGGVSNSTQVETQLYEGLPVVRQTQSGNINYIDIRLDVNELYSQDNSGTYPTTFTYVIEYKPTSGTDWITPVNQTVSGKTTSTYVKQIRIPVAPLTNDTYEVRVTKISGESTTSYFCTLIWESFEEITVGSYTWSGTSCVQLYGQATNQFSSLPPFSGVYKGRIIKVPSNYNPVTKTYSGAWDGTFQLAYTDNPPWILYDYLTNTKYGMSAYSPIYIDKYSIYDAGVWCDQTMANGAARYTFNELIASQRNGRDQATYIAGIFNAAFFDDGNGTAYIKIDQPDPATHIFAEENTIDGFQYSFSDLSTRYNYITVTFTNPDLNWDQDQRIVQDPTDIAMNGKVPLNFIAQGCTSEFEAINRAMYKMVTSMTEVTSVTFKTNRQGSFVLPWEVVLVADPSTGYAVSGRINSIDSTGTVLTLRDPVTLEVGQNYGINIAVPNGIFTANVLTPSAGATTTLTLDQAVPSGLPAYSVFSLSGGALGLPKPFRVVKIERVDGNQDQVQITAVEINRDKWTAINEGIVLNTTSYNTQNLTSVAAITNLTATQTVTSSSAGTRIDLDISWTGSTSRWVTDYQVAYNLNGGATTTVTTNGDTQAVIPNVLAGTYTITVLAVGFGITSPPTTITYNVSADGIELAAVTGLELAGQGNSAVFTGKDAAFDWRFNSAYGGHEPLGSETGDGAGYLDPWFRCFQITILDPAGKTLRMEETQVPSYTYTFEKNLADGGGAPNRFFTIQVVWYDNFGRVSPPASLSVNNPPAALPTGIAVNASFQNVYVTWANDKAVDFQGTIVWASQTSGFTPSDATKVYDGPDSMATIPSATGVTWYVVLASYDTFGEYDLTYSGEFSIATAKLQGTDIAKGIINNDMLTDDLSSTIDLITAGPQTPGSVAAQIAALQTNLDGQVTQINDTINSLTATVDGNTAAITDEESARADGDAANASAIKALTATVQNNYATNTSVSQALAGINSSLSSQLNALSASVASNYATNTSLSQAIAGINSASSSFLSQLNSSVNGLSTSVQQAMSSVNGVSGQWTVKIDNNGNVCGIGLMSTSNGTGGVTSEFQVLANQFEIVNPTTNGKVAPFIVKNGNVYMDAGTVEILNLVVQNAQIAEAAIDTAQIAELAVTGDKIVVGAVSNRGMSNVYNGPAGVTIQTSGNPVTLYLWWSPIPQPDNGDWATLDVVCDGSRLGVSWGFGSGATSTAGTASISTVLQLTAGTHTLTVIGWDQSYTTGNWYQTPVTTTTGLYLLEMLK